MKKILLFTTLSTALSTFAQIQVIDTENDIEISSLSDNGEIATFSSPSKMYIWTKETGVQELSNYAPTVGRSGTVILNADGTKISSTVMNPSTGNNEMGLYDISTKTWKYLGGLKHYMGNEESSAYSISNDGKTVVGLGWFEKNSAHAISWNETTGIKDLGSSVVGNSSRANDVNSNGDIIVGWQDNSEWYRQGAIWKDGKQTLFFGKEGEYAGEAIAVSSNGKWIVGGYLNYDAWIWSEETGIFPVGYPNAGMDLKGVSTGVSNDGQIVVGFFQAMTAEYSSNGFIWTPQTGAIPLTEYLKTGGIDVSGYYLYGPEGITDNGKFVFGRGLKDGKRINFIVELPELLATNEIAKNEINIYPNPVKDQINISTKDKIAKTEIYSLTGQLIKSTKLENNKLDVQNLKSGTYILKIIFENQKEITQKFIKK